MKAIKVFANIAAGTALIGTGYFLGKKKKKPEPALKTSGLLIVDNSEPGDAPAIYAQFEVTVKEIENSEYITLKVIKK